MLPAGTAFAMTISTSATAPRTLSGAHGKLIHGSETAQQALWSAQGTRMQGRPERAGGWSINPTVLAGVSWQQGGRALNQRGGTFPNDTTESSAHAQTPASHAPRVLHCTRPCSNFTLQSHLRALLATYVPHATAFRPWPPSSGTQCVQHRHRHPQRSSRRRPRCPRTGAW